jgi:hypothetical protein
VLRCHACNQRCRPQADDVADLAADEWLKHDELIHAVDKLRPAVVQVLKSAKVRQ